MPVSHVGNLDDWLSAGLYRPGLLVTEAGPLPCVLIAFGSILDDDVARFFPQACCGKVNAWSAARVRDVSCGRRGAQSLSSGMMVTVGCSRQLSRWAAVTQPLEESGEIYASLDNGELQVVTASGAVVVTS